jgi:hypothetical protein
MGPPERGVARRILGGAWDAVDLHNGCKVLGSVAAMGKNE